MRKPVIAILVAIGLIFFSHAAQAQSVPDSLADVYERILTVEPLGPDFAPAHGLEPCGKHFLATPEGTSFPPSIVMFLDRFKDLRFEYDQRVFLNSIHVIVDSKRLTPRARLHYQSGWVTAELWMPANELDNCPCLKGRVNIPLR